MRNEEAKAVKGYEEAVFVGPCLLVDQDFMRNNMTNYVRMTLELEKSKEMSRRPRQNHWFCDYISSACCSLA